MNRAPVDQILDAVEWAANAKPEVDDGTPYATHSGVLEIGPTKIRCYRLNDGRAILDAGDFEKFFAGLEA